MKPRTLRYRTFAEIAAEMAKKRHGDWWRPRRDDYLEALIQDHWFGRFMDNAGQSCVFDLVTRQFGPPAFVTREFVWRLLGDDKPQTVREVREVSLQLWKTLASAKIEEYGGNVVRGIFEKLALSEPDARAWMDQYDEEKLPRVQFGTQHTPSAVPPEPIIHAGGARKRGRPTLKDEFEAAYKELRDAKQIDFGAPKNMLYEPIREKVRAHKDDLSLQRGLGDDAIRKAIRPLFEKDKSAHPTSP